MPNSVLLTNKRPCLQAERCPVSCTLSTPGPEACCPYCPAHLGQHEVPDLFDDWSFFPQLLHGLTERIWTGGDRSSTLPGSRAGDAAKGKASLLLGLQMPLVDPGHWGHVPTMRLYSLHYLWLHHTPATSSPYPIRPWGLWALGLVTGGWPWGRIIHAMSCFQPQLLEELGVGKGMRTPRQQPRCCNVTLGPHAPPTLLLPTCP